MTEGKHMVWMILELLVLSIFKPAITLDPLKKRVLFPHQASVSAADSGGARMLEMVNFQAWFSSYATVSRVRTAPTEAKTARTSWS